MNSLLSNLGRMMPTTQTAAKTPSILMQAFGAYMRGEDASTFMKNLANTHPQLKPYNLDDLSTTAHKICQQNGIDPNTAAQQVTQALGTNMF